MNQEEVWKSIPGYEGFYEASCFGRIRSMDVFRKFRGGMKLWKSRILHANNVSFGYLAVTLYGPDERKRSRLIHRLVAMAFLPNTEGKSDINHKNGDKKDNRVENIEWSTRQDNILHAHHVLGLRVGEKHHAHKLKRADIPEIRKLRAEGTTITAIAKIFGVSSYPIYDIIRGKTWIHS